MLLKQNYFLGLLILGSIATAHLKEKIMNIFLMSYLIGRLVVAMVILASALTPNLASAGEPYYFGGLSPAGATDYHILLDGPIVPGGGVFESVPFSHPIYDPNVPTSVINYAVSTGTVATDTQFGLLYFRLEDVDPKLPAPLNGLKILGAWWTIDDVEQTTGGTKFDNAYLVPVPEASTYGMMLAGLGLVGAMVARRRKHIQAVALT